MSLAKQVNSMADVCILLNDQRMLATQKLAAIHSAQQNL